MTSCLGKRPISIFWDLSTLEKVAVLDARVTFWCFAFSTSTVVAGGNDGCIYVYDTRRNYVLINRWNVRRQKKDFPVALKLTRADVLMITMCHEGVIFFSLSKQARTPSERIAYGKKLHLSCSLDSGTVCVGGWNGYFAIIKIPRQFVKNSDTPDRKEVRDPKRTTSMVTGDRSASRPLRRELTTRTGSLLPLQDDGERKLAESFRAIQGHQSLTGRRFVQARLHMRESILDECTRHIYTKYKYMDDLRKTIQKATALVNAAVGCVPLICGTPVSSEGGVEDCGEILVVSGLVECLLNVGGNIGAFETEPVDDSDIVAEDDVSWERKLELNKMALAKETKELRLSIEELKTRIDVVF